MKAVYWLMLWKLHKKRSGDAKSKRLHSRYRKAFYRALSAEDQRRRQLRINRPSLLPIARSPWRKALCSRDDQALITITGFDWESLKYIFAKFAPIFESHSPFLDRKIVPKHLNKGRKRLIRPEDGAGLVLMWTRTRGPLVVLQMIFGMTMTNFGMYLRFGRRIMVEVFRNDPLAKIRLPSGQKIKEYQKAIGERHSMLKDVWTTMDGVKLYLQKAGNDVIQEQYYNGWTHGHYVTSVFCFCPDGTIPIAFYNVPGSVHDSQVADWGDVYLKVESMFTKHGVKCTVDSAFGAKDREYLVKSGQDYLVSDADTVRGRNKDIQMKRQATAMRQSAEWGMKLLQCSFPRLKDRFIYEERGERRIMLKLMVLLFNMRAQMVGINQIRNVYMPQLNRSANEYIETV